MVAGIPPIKLLEFKDLQSTEWDCFRAYTRRRIERNHMQIDMIKTQLFRFDKLVNTRKAV